MTTPEIAHQPTAEEIAEQTTPAATHTAINTDIFADKVPADANDIHETPMGGTLASAAPLNGPPVNEIPMYETPDQEIPMGGTLAAEGPMDEDPASEIPVDAPVVVAGNEDAAVVFVAPPDGSVVYITPVQKKIYQVPLGDTIPYKIPAAADDEALAALRDHTETD
jgi:hypothetical protein